MSDEELIDCGTAAAQIIEAARARKGAKLTDVAQFCDDSGPVPMIAVPLAGGGVEMNSVLDELKLYQEWRRERPDRREGTAKLEDLDSFVRHTNRFKDPDSSIWISGDPKAPSFQSVLDYHEAVNPEEPATKALPEGGVKGPLHADITSGPRTALPRFGKHRGSYKPVFSDEWKLWTEANGKPLGQAAFAALIEKGARDIVDVEDEPEGLKDGEEIGPNAPRAFAKWFHSRFGGSGKTATEITDFYASTATLLDMSERLVITIEEKVGEVSSRSGGSRALVFEGETRSEVVIPSALLLQLPVFRGGDLVQMPARLRVQARQKGDGTRSLEFTVNLYGVDRIIAKDVADMGEEIKAKTGLPVFVGAPE